MRNLIGLIIATIMIGVVVGLAVVVYVPKPEMVAEVSTCHTFHVAFPGPVDLIYMGQVELCGENMEWSNIWGAYWCG